MWSLSYIFINCFAAILNFVPLPLRLLIIEGILRALFFVLPKYKRIAFRNLSQVFPGQTALHQTIWHESFSSLARLIVDMLRIHRLTEEWVRSHITFPCCAEWKEFKKRAGTRGVLAISAHLGSFELMAHAAPYWFEPMTIVVRPFKMRGLDEWWNRNRSSSGNDIIPREGAFREIVRRLKKGRSVGILMDQNITRERAVFVPWFGHLAATTKAVALAGVMTEAPIGVFDILYKGGDRYELGFTEVDCTDVYKDSNLSSEDKCLVITTRVAEELQRKILKNPAGWFWMHKRWRTTPAGIPETFY